MSAALPILSAVTAMARRMVERSAGRNAGRRLRAIPALAPNPPALALGPVVLGLLCVRLLLEAPVPNPPAVWYSQSPKPARYDRAIRVQARVTRVLSPGLYLMRVRITSLEKRKRIRYRKKKWASYYKRRRRAKAAGPDGWTKSTYGKKYRGRGRARTHLRVHAAGQSDGWSNRRTSYRKRNRGHYRKKYRGKRKSKYAKNYGKKHRSGYRKKYRGRYGPWRRLVRPAGAAAESFPVLAALPHRGLFPGCRLDLRLYGYRAPRKPGTDERSRSFAAYLRRKGAASYIKTGKKNVLSRTCGPVDSRTRFRAKLDELLRKRGGLRGTALEAARGILLGDSRALNRGFRARARKLGLLHLFAASGLHLAIFYACLYWPLSRLLGKRRPLAVLAPLPACLAYLWLLDFPVSLSRAFVFVLIFAGKSLIHRRLTITDQLSNAALVLLLLLPRELASISGMLSFGAVAGILYFHGVLLEGVFQPAHKITRLIFSQFCVTIAAGLFTTPMLIQAFGAHSHGGPAANFLLVPLVGLVLPLLYAALALSWLPLFSDGLWWTARHGMETFARLTDGLSDYGLYSRYENLWNPPVLACTAMLGLLIALKRIHQERQPARARLLNGMRLSVLICIALLGPAGAMVMDLIRILTYIANSYVRFPL